MLKPVAQAVVVTPLNIKNTSFWSKTCIQDFFGDQ
jgi:hypothetical protein